MNRLRLLRRVVAVAMLLAATLLFLDFTGLTHCYLGWVAKVQFIPALLASHFLVVLLLCVATLIFGRLYCSIICPLGLFQDAVSRISSATNKRRKFIFSPAKRLLRGIFLALFIIAIIAGVGSFMALLEPYAAFGRMVSTLLTPIYKAGNNLLAMAAERADSYAFYSVDIILSSVGMFAVAIITLLVVGTLAWRNGRSYCNTVCPVGTLLGLISKFSLLKLSIDKSKCNGCRKCARNCKASCIDADHHAIDYSRCVVCFDCIDNCNQGAISYTLRRKKVAQTAPKEVVDSTKRNMLAVGSALLVTNALKAEGKLVDGGLAHIEGKQAHERRSRIVPAGAISQKNFADKCVGCQLCVTVCPNNVLHPSTSLMTFMQPEASFEKGYCRPECTKCSEVCPAGAITPIDKATKASTRIGCAVLVRQNCVILTDGVECGSCAAHCPSGAIKMVEAKDKELYGDRKIPAIDTSRCIGCGACENLCPARPFSAIYVEGLKKHITI